MFGVKILKWFYKTIAIVLCLIAFCHTTLAYKKMFISIVDLLLFDVAKSCLYRLCNDYVHVDERMWYRYMHRYK